MGIAGSEHLGFRVWVGTVCKGRIAFKGFRVWVGITQGLTHRTGPNVILTHKPSAGHDRAIPV